MHPADSSEGPEKKRIEVICVTTAARTHKGKIRTSNEDNFCISDGQNKLLAVADGMGGHKGGKIASALAIESLKSYFSSLDGDDFSVPECLRKCVEKINRDVLEKSCEEDKLKGMGTTLVMLYQVGATAYVVNVGDSRCYLIRNRAIKQITKDHSVIQELYDSGKINLEDMKNHPNKNMITRAIGTDSKVECDIFEIELKCNDGFIRWTFKYGK